MSYNTIDNLLEAKILSLLHDPPGKWAIITGKVKRNKIFPEPLLVDANSFFTRKKKAGAHENVAMVIAYKLLKHVLSNPMNAWKIVGAADNLASSYDRLENILGRRKGLPVDYGPGLVNIFNTRLYYSRIILDTVKTAEWKVELVHSLDKLVCSFQRDIQTLGENRITELYHLLYAFLQPIWSHVSKGKFVGPADTRVPHHLLLDHLYATATAVNIVAGSSDGVAGYLVYIGFRNLREWLTESRKLSDLWVSSWLATALIWYAIKELVWILGPDIVVIPTQRWNHYYLSLILNKLGGMVPSEDLKDAFKLYYFDDYHEFPVHAWQPAYAVLVLPASTDWKKIAEKICPGAQSLPTPLVSSGIIEWMLKCRIRTAWRKIVAEVLVDKLRYMLKNYREAYIGNDENVEELIEKYASNPPLQEVVVVSGIPYRSKTKRARLKEASLKGKADKFDNEYECIMMNAISKAWSKKGKDLPHRIFNSFKIPSGVVIDGKLAYTFKTVELIEEAEREVALSPIGSGSISAEPGHEGRLWRHCTVCGRRVAVFKVPGKIIDGEPDEEYKNFAANINQEVLDIKDKKDSVNAWRIVLPIFKPGERLCFHDLVKRLLGLARFFRKVARELIGYTPEKEWEPGFPSTDDIAVLATKLTLADLLVKVLKAYSDKGEDIYQLIEPVLKEYGKLYEVISQHPRFFEAKHVKSVKKFYINHRPWIPRLLDDKLKELEEAYEAVSEKVGEAGGERRSIFTKTALAVLMTNIIGFYDLISDKEIGPRVRDIFNRLADLIEVLKDKIIGEEKARYYREALLHPRLYYYIIWFDADKVKYTLMGLLMENGQEVDPGRYIENMLESIVKVLESRRKARRRRGKSTGKSRIIEAIKSVNPDDFAIKRIADCFATFLVSPSYHSALSHSLAITLYEAGLWAERLGGVAVYLAGDSGIVLLPAWLPRIFIDDYTRGNLERIIGEDNDVKEGYPDSPGLIYAYVLRRIFWGADTTCENEDSVRLIGDDRGFHPVKMGWDGRPLYYVPALVSNGLSIAVRASHYRDHMRGELSTAKYLLGKAKDRGDTTVISYGRLNPSLRPLAVDHVLLRNNPGGSIEESIPQLSYPLRLVIKHLYYMNPPPTQRPPVRISSNMPRDPDLLLPSARSLLHSLGRDDRVDFASKLYREILARNTRGRKEDKEAFIEWLTSEVRRAMKVFEMNALDDLLPSLIMTYQAMKSSRRLDKH